MVVEAAVHLSHLSLMICGFESLSDICEEERLQQLVQERLGCKSEDRSCKRGCKSEWGGEAATPGVRAARVRTITFNVMLLTQAYLDL